SLVDQSTDKVITRLREGENWQVRLENNRIVLEKKGQKELYGPFANTAGVKESGTMASVRAAGGDIVEKEVSGLVVMNQSGKVRIIEAGMEPVVRGVAGSAALSKSKGLNLVSLDSGAGFKRYRGNMEFVVEGGKLAAVNELNIEDYLKGVVPSEIPGHWPAEALKAQAVAARNFAMKRVQTSRGGTYNLTNDQYSQVYGGYDAENPATNKAVDETRGMVMLSRGELVTAYFHSSSGGFTENCEDVWREQLPYIKTREDPFDKNDRHYDWQVTYTVEQLKEKLASAGYEFDTVTDIEELARTSSGARVEKLAVKGTDKDDKPVRIEISNADNVRIALGLKSALFTFNKVFDKDKRLSGVTVKGSGWGHGLGMSQWGAQGMAKAGYNYQDILKYYYTGIKLVPGYGRSAS
ncbi:MAG: SpoIID/LytB domain-containing protein, partial [Firmicutes bacterium]|nr:SpoIID/LytB domain-containing protein [Bacillota bacterium]